MTRTALILAAHGSRHHPSVNAEVRRCAAGVRDRGGFDEVAVAFHQGAPTFADVLDTLRAGDVTVVPFMTSDGYYARTVLPRELARNTRFASMNVRITAPVGTHPRIADLMADRIRRCLEPYRLPKNATSLAVVGHGTKRHADSRRATLDLCRSLRQCDVAGEVLAAFIGEPPGVQTILSRACLPNVLAVPFLIGAGPHATRDIPAALGIADIAASAGARALPVVGSVGGRIIACDTPIGGDPGIIDIVAALAGNPPGAAHRWDARKERVA